MAGFRTFGLQCHKFLYLVRLPEKLRSMGA